MIRFRFLVIIFLVGSSFAKHFTKIHNGIHALRHHHDDSRLFKDQASNPTLLFVKANASSGIRKSKIAKLFQRRQNYRLYKRENLPDSSNQIRHAIAITEEAVKLHNIFRRIHRVPDITVDTELAKLAQADAVHNAEKGYVTKRRDIKEGEGVAYKCSTNEPYTMEDVVKDWYKEICMSPSYDFMDEPDHTLSVGKFTQMIWKSSTKLGCGSAKKIGDDGLTCYYYSCRYNKRGNIIGSYLSNVKAGKFVPDKVCSNLDNMVNRAVQRPDDHFIEPYLVKSKASRDVMTGMPTQGSKHHPINVRKKPRVEHNASTRDSGTNEQDCTLYAFASRAQRAVTEIASVSGNQDSEENPMKYQEDAIKVMNKFREIHSTEPLVVNFELYEQAKQIASLLVQDGKASIQTKDTKDGLSQMTCNMDGKMLPPEEAISNWYREVCTKTLNYDLENEASLSRAPHFTQLVWSTSEKTGVAVKTTKQGNLSCTIVVAKFDPVGNTAGDFSRNVRKGKFDMYLCGSIESIASSAVNTRDTHAKDGGACTKRTVTDECPQGRRLKDAKVNKKTNNEASIKLKGPVITIQIKASNDSLDEEQQEQPLTTPSPESETPSTVGPSNETTEPPIQSESQETEPTLSPNQPETPDNKPVKSPNQPEISETEPTLSPINEESPNNEPAQSPVQPGNPGGGPTQPPNQPETETNQPEAQTNQPINTEEEPTQPSKQPEDSTINPSQPSNQLKMSDNKPPHLPENPDNKTQETPNQQEGPDSDPNSIQNNKPEGSENGQTPSVNGPEIPDSNLSPNHNEETNNNNPNQQTETNNQNPSSPQEGEIDEPPGPLQNEPEQPNDGKKPNGKQGPVGKSNLTEDFNSQALRAHNSLRQLHNSPPMTEDALMSKQAEAYAKKIGKMGTLRHSVKKDIDNPEGDGENLAYVCGGNPMDFKGSDVTKMWYEEVCNPGYKFHPPKGFSSGTGHFTQVVWKESTKLGIGKAIVRDCVYVVGRYRTPGNMMGAFKDNVQKGRFNQAYCKKGKIDEVLTADKRKFSAVL